MALHDDVAVVRCIIDSLADSYRSVLDDIEDTSGASIDVLHVVGGGSRNRMLCQVTANVTGRDVLAGPTEASSVGNLLVQARAAGAVTGGLDALREIVRRSSRLTRYQPQPIDGLR
jgi:rhamnulokinase